MGWIQSPTRSTRSLATGSTNSREMEDRTDRFIDRMSWKTGLETRARNGAQGVDTDSLGRSYLDDWTILYITMVETSSAFFDQYELPGNCDHSKCFHRYPPMHSEYSGAESWQSWRLAGKHPFCETYGTRLYYYNCHFSLAISPSLMRGNPASQ